MEIEYYGATTPLSDVAIISIMENQLMTVNGFDRTTYQQMSQVLFEHLLSNEYYMQFNIQFDFPLIVIKPKNHTDSFKQQDTNDEDTVPFMGIEIKVPTLPESVTEATVAKWLKSKGDSVEADEAIVELETDKVNLEVPSPVTGILTKIDSKDGSIVEVGALLGSVSENGTNSKKVEEMKKIEPLIVESNLAKLDTKKEKKEIEIFEENVNEEEPVDTPLVLTKEVKEDQKILKPNTNVSSSNDNHFLRDFF